jgi:hypothetical protein
MSDHEDVLGGGAGRGGGIAGPATIIVRSPPALVPPAAFDCERDGGLSMLKDGHIGYVVLIFIYVLLI